MLLTAEIWVHADDQEPAILDVDEHPVTGATLVMAEPPVAAAATGVR
jgi:hypothetical protein